MLNELCNVNLVQGVKHVEEIITLRQTRFWSRVREVPHDLRYILTVRKEVLDGKLIENRNVHEFHILKSHKLFILRE